MLKLLCPLLITGFVFSLISCGKKEKKDSGVYTPHVDPEPEREAFLAKQEIACEPGTYCPDYIAKIVVFDKGTPRYCTGTLVSKNKLLTSASCLPSYLRSTDSDCSQDVHFFFNKGNRPPERLKCKSILQVSSIDADHPEYWRDDVAVLEMSDNLYWREFRDVSRKGIKDMDKLRFFAVEQMNDSTGIIRKEECEAVLGSYLFPLSATESSPNILLAGCKRKTGYRGAGIMDSFPRIRAVLSDNSPLRAALENSPLLVKPLKEFVHVSNFACAQFMDETSTVNEQECAKQLDYSALANERTRLFSDDERFTSIVSKLEKTASDASRFYRFAASLIQDNDKFVTSFRPVCFKSVNSWLNSVKGNGEVTETPELPSHALKKGIDSYGRAITQETENQNTKYYLTFSGKRLFKEKLSDVFVSTDDTAIQRLNSMKACQ